MKRIIGISLEVLGWVIVGAAAIILFWWLIGHGDMNHAGIFLLMAGGVVSIVGLCVAITGRILRDPGPEGSSGNAAA